MLRKTSERRNLYLRDGSGEFLQLEIREYFMVALNNNRFPANNHGCNHLYCDPGFHFMFVGLLA
jgi:hypothetical protein